LADVIVEDVGPCKKKLKISIPQSEIQEKIEDAYTRLKDSAVVDGFRKGHVPRKLLERRFGEEVVDEVKQSVLSEAAQSAIEEHSMSPLGEPSFDNVEFEADKECVFEVTLEVEPEFDLPEYTGLKLQKKATRVSDEELNQAIENLRMRHATLELAADDATVQANDVVVADWALNCGEETVASENNDQFMVVGRQFGEVELTKEMPEVLGGAASGEAREAEVKFLESYPIEKWRDKDGVLSIIPKEIRRPILPELDEEFAKRLDFDSIDEMNEYVKRMLAQGKERDIALDVERQLFDQLIEKAPFELPEGIHKAQARNIMVRQQFRLKQRGMPDEEVEKHLSELRDASEEAAARNLKVYFILDRIADKEKLFVTENDVANRIAAMANSYKMSTQRMRSQLEQEGSLSQLRSGMREDKVTEFLLGKAEIEEEET